MSAPEQQQPGSSEQQQNGLPSSSTAPAAASGPGSADTDTAAVALAGLGGSSGRVAASSAPAAVGGTKELSIASMLDRIVLAGHKKEAKQKYAFWETQPVMQFDEPAAGSNGGDAAEDGPIDAPKTVADVRKEPYALPDSFKWCDVNINDQREVQEVYELLHKNYVEDDDAMFRFSYSPAFLAWALQPPGYRSDWHVGVRVQASGKLVAFISGVPATIQANGQRIRAVEINFLCVLKKLRSKRLAPVLIKEITRRVNLQNIWQAAYTAGVVLPKPVSQCRYWHRSLNPKKLIDVGFSVLAPRMTMARTLKLYRLPSSTATPGLRPMVAADVTAVTALLNAYLARYKLTQHFDEAEVAHWFLPRPLVVDTYVVEQPSSSSSSGGSSSGGSSSGQQQQQQDGAAASSSSSIVSMFSFYTLPSSVLGHETHTELRAAYMYYTVPGPTTDLAQLLQDALIAAASKGYDVFNALDLLENGPLLRELKFGIGDGSLQYYLYNWRLGGAPLPPSDVGLILL